MPRFLCLWRDEKGATAIEYTLIAGLISIAIYAGVVALGGGVGDLFNNTANAVQTNM